jgi:hypothetical protein
MQLSKKRLMAAPSKAFRVHLSDNRPAIQKKVIMMGDDGLGSRTWFSRSWQFSFVVITPL